MTKNLPQSTADWRPMLLAVPLRNTAVQVARDDGALVSLKVKNRKPGYLVPPISWMVPFKPYRTIELDALGTSLWRQCDGKRTVEDLCDWFAERHRLTFHEARSAVTGYLSQLVKRGILAIAMNDQPT